MKYELWAKNEHGQPEPRKYFDAISDEAAREERKKHMEVTGQNVQLKSVIEDFESTAVYCPGKRG